MKKSIVLFLFLLLMGPVIAYSQVFIPYYLPGPDYVTLTVNPGLPGETTYASVSVMLPDSCTLVGTWAALNQVDNVFYIDVETVSLFDTICLTVISFADNTYDLGELAEGEYTVIVTNYGVTMQTVSFTVSDEPVETPDPTVTPTETPEAYECGDYNEDGQVISSTPCLLHRLMWAW